MMRRFAFCLLPSVLLALAACRFWVPATAPNPDPNHTHADFAVWLDGEQLDFSGPEFMSGSSKDEPAGEHQDRDHKHPYFHLHDGNGHVIHRHKPGLALKDFFDSLRVGFDDHCYSSGVPMADGQICSKHPWRMFVNGKEVSFNLSYVFEDADHILVTTAVDQADVDRELQKMTDDACLYSQTCLQRGKPPVENCVADPEVPCTE